MPRALRIISWAPTSYSRSRIWRLSEGCAVCSLRSAATVRLPSSATATKKRRCRSSIAYPMPPKYGTSLQSIRGSRYQNQASSIRRHVNVFIRRPSGPAKSKGATIWAPRLRSEEHTSELQSPCNLVCRLLLEKKKKNIEALLGTQRGIDLGNLAIPEPG